LLNYVIDGYGVQRLFFLGAHGKMQFVDEIPLTAVGKVDKKVLR